LAAKRLPAGDEDTESCNCSTVGGGVQQEGLADAEDAGDIVARYGCTVGTCQVQRLIGRRGGGGIEWSSPMAATAQSQRNGQAPSELSEKNIQVKARLKIKWQQQVKKNPQHGQGRQGWACEVAGFRQGGGQKVSPADSRSLSSRGAFAEIVDVTRGRALEAALLELKLS
jgi:hypothetical protein